ncbi:O-methyltransferase [Mesorhizobium sp. RSR380A]
MKNTYVSAVRFARKIADCCGLLASLERSNIRGLLWIRSLFGIYDSADLVRLDMPWWTFSAIDAVDIFLASRNRSARVYEFGAGASTVWLAKRSASINSVEHDAPFARTMDSMFGAYPNIAVRVVEPTATSTSTKARSNRKGYTESSFDHYVSSIDQVEGTFDLIVIDGRARVSCLAKSVSRLSPGGMILFDNSNRLEYREAINSCGLQERVMRGLAPALPFPSQTSLLTLRA